MPPCLFSPLLYDTSDPEGRNRGGVAWWLMVDGGVDGRWEGLMVGGRGWILPNKKLGFPLSMVSNISMVVIGKNYFSIQSPIR